MVTASSEDGSPQTGRHDAIDTLLSRIQPAGSQSGPSAAGLPGNQRLLDFVRKKYRKIQAEKAELEDRVKDLEHSLEIIQTAQAWSLGNSMSHAQAQKIKEVTSLLLQAKKARQDALNFSKIGKGALFEKLRVYKNMLQKERQEKREMRDRLVQAFEQAKFIKEKNKQLEERRKREREIWQQMIRQMRDKHYREFDKLKKELGEHDVQKHERMRQLGNFGEKVMAELQNLQEHLNYVKQETVENVEAAQNFGGSQYAAFGSTQNSANDGDFFITQG